MPQARGLVVMHLYHPACLRLIQISIDLTAEHLDSQNGPTRLQGVGDGHMAHHSHASSLEGLASERCGEVEGVDL